MIGAVLAPLRGVAATVAALPRVIEAILVLPHLSRQLDQVSEHTAHLAAILEELEHVRSDTIALPLQGAAVRVGRLADRLPQRRAARPPA